MSITQSVILDWKILTCPLLVLSEFATLISSRNHVQILVDWPISIGFWPSYDPENFYVVLGLIVSSPCA